MNKKLKHSLKYISDKLGKKTGFSIPKDYIENFDVEVVGNNNDVHLPKENSFEVPKDYFDNIDEKILNKLSPNVKEVKVIPFKNKIRKFLPYSVAASILLLIGGYLYISTREVTFQDISVTDIESWYDEGYGEVKENALVSVIETSDFSENALDELFISNTEINEYVDLMDDFELVNELESN